jgi:hypothetical protein
LKREPGEGLELKREAREALELKHEPGEGLELKREAREALD